MTIDNGNHLLLSGNRAALSYLDAIGARHLLIGPGRGRAFPFIDLEDQRALDAAGERRLHSVVDTPSRPPRAGNARARLSRRCSICCARRRDAKVGDVMTCEGPLYDRLVGPFLLAALNVDPPEGSAALAAAVVSETLLRGRARLPSADRARRAVAARSSSRAWRISPSTRRHGARSNGSFARFAFEGDRVAALDFGERHRSGSVQATRSCSRCRPGPRRRSCPAWRRRPSSAPSSTPTSRSTRRPPCRPSPASIGGTVEWLFTFPGRLSVTISGADRLLTVPREELAAQDLARCRADRGHCG